MRFPLLVLTLSLVGAILAALGMAWLMLTPPMADMVALAQFLFLSGVTTILSAYVLYRLKFLGKFHSLRWALFAAISVTILLIFVNVWFTAHLMFIDNHDLALNTLLQVFAGIISTAVGYLIAGAVIEKVQQVVIGAEKLAEGDLSTRVPVEGRDEIAELARAFNQMASRLQEVDHQKRGLERTRRDLIAWVSHDLRTPLTSMRVMIEAMADGVVDDPNTVDRYLKNMLGEIRHLNKMIDDLFELAQLDAGHIDFTREPSSLRDLISDTLESMSAQAARYDITLKGMAEEGIDPVYMAPEKIQRVLYNLIMNAIRHTAPGGQIILAAHLIGNEVQIEVQDSGEGIKPEEVPLIFDSFYRGEMARSRDQDGTRGVGLGLAIARRMVEAHDGKIWVESTPGQGARFRFTLPRFMKGSPLEITGRNGQPWQAGGVP